MRCFLSQLHLIVLGMMSVGLLANTADAGLAYENPVGGWTYTYDGEDADDAPNFESLDGTWDHDNGSDQWDGTGIGAGSPGGVFVLDEGNTTFLRMVDTGDPTQQGVPEPSNRKFFFTHNIGEGGDEAASDTQIDDGITLSFRARIPTEGPLEGVSPGDGYVNHNGGKSTFTVSQAGDGGKTISFFLAAEEEDQTSFLGPGLGMNSLDETGGGAVDWQGDGGTPLIFELDNPTEWHEFWINILAVDGLPGSHLAVIYADGSVAETPFNLSAGTGRDEDINYITMGLGSTPQSGAVDIDFFSWAPGVLQPIATSTDWPGDVDGDGHTDVSDLNIIGINWQMSGKTKEEGDLTGDGNVDAADLNVLALNWQTWSDGPPAAATVPEPGTATLLLVGLLAASGTVRKRRC